MKCLITLTIMGCMIYASLCLTASVYKSICNPEKADWNDDFTTFNPRWDWNYNKGTGYKRLTTIDNVSVVEIGITNQSSSSSYSDCSLHETSYQYNYGVFEARLRYTGDHEFGTMGWGFWNYENPEKADCAWFWDASPEGDASGFQAMVADNSIIKFQKHLPEIDIEQWHIYRVELLPTGTRFLVDGNEVAFTPQRPHKLQKIEMWIDNYYVQVVGDKLKPVGYINVQQNQRMYIDWVRYYDYSNRPPVLDPIGNKTVNGGLLEFTVTASDPDADNLTYSASNLPIGSTFDPATQIFSRTPDYRQAGNYIVLFTVSDDGDPPLSDSEEVTITVDPANNLMHVNTIEVTKQRWWWEKT